MLEYKPGDIVEWNGVKVPIIAITNEDYLVLPHERGWDLNKYVSKCYLTIPSNWRELTEAYLVSVPPIPGTFVYIVSPETVWKDNKYQIIKKIKEEIGLSGDR